VTAPSAAPGRKSVLDEFEVIVDHPFGCACFTCGAHDPDSPLRTPHPEFDAIVAPEETVDVARVGRLIILRAGQSHENAVEQLSKLFPSEHPDDIIRIVRAAMPNAPSLENLSRELHGASPDWVRGTVETDAAPMSKQRVRILAGAVAAGVTALSLGVYALLSALNSSPFDSPEFTELAKAAHFQCRALSDSQAECRNVAEDTIWKVTAFQGVDADPTSFRFSHGDELAVVWIFDTPEQRQAFPQLAGYQRLYPVMSSRDRVIVAATDADVMADLAGALDDSVLDGVGGGAPTAHPTTVGRPVMDWPTRVPTTLTPWPSTATPTRTVEPSRPGPGASVPEQPSQAATEAPAAPSEPARPAPSTDPDPSPSQTQPPAADTGTPSPAPGPDPTPSDEPTQSGSKMSVTISLPGIFIGL